MCPVFQPDQTGCSYFRNSGSNGAQVDSGRGPGASVTSGSAVTGCSSFRRPASAGAHKPPFARDTTGRSGTQRLPGPGRLLADRLDLGPRDVIGVPQPPEGVVGRVSEPVPVAEVVQPPLL